MIPIIDKVIDRVNPIWKCQESILVFTDHKVQIIGYGDVELTGMDGYGDENEAPLNIKNENNLDYQEDQEYFHPDQEDQTIQQTVKV